MQRDAQDGMFAALIVLDQERKDDRNYYGVLSSCIVYRCVITVAIRGRTQAKTRGRVLVTLGQNPNPGEIQIEAQRGSAGPLQGLLGSDVSAGQEKEGDHEVEVGEKEKTSWPFDLQVIIGPFFTILVQGKVGHLLTSVTPRGPASCQKTPPAVRYLL